MALTFEQHENVQLFLDNEMTPEQEAAFVQEMEGDETLQEYLRFEVQLRENLSTSSKPVPKAKVLNPKAVIAIAASLLLIAAGAVWFFMNPFQKPAALAKSDRLPTIGEKPADTSKKAQAPEMAYTALYNTFYAKDEVPALPEGFETLGEALDAYKGGQYGKIQAMDVTHPPPSRGLLLAEYRRTFRELGHYYQALSFMETNGSEKAAAGLDWVIANGNDKRLVQKARWYKALLQLKQGDATKTAALLSMAAGDTSTPTGRKAVALLHLLRK